MGQIEKLEAETQLQLQSFRHQAINDFDMQYGQNRLINSPDDIVRNTAVELLVDRYTLSKIYTRQGDIVSEQDQLPILVPRAVYELRNAIVSDLIADLTKELAALPPTEPDRAVALMKQITDYKAFQKQLAEVLGERIILPKQR